MSKIVASDDTLGGKPRVEGTRVSAEQILEMRESGMTIEEIADVLPTVSAEEVNSIL